MTAARLLADAGPLCGCGRGEIGPAVVKKSPNRGANSVLRGLGSSDRCKFFQFQAASPSAPRPLVSAPSGRRCRATRPTSPAVRPASRSCSTPTPRRSAATTTSFTWSRRTRTAPRSKVRSCRARIKAELGDCEHGVRRDARGVRRGGERGAGGEGLDAAVGEGLPAGHAAARARHLLRRSRHGLRGGRARRPRSLPRRGRGQGRRVHDGRPRFAPRRAAPRAAPAALRRRRVPQNVRWRAVCRVACGRAALSDGKTHVIFESEPLFADATRPPARRPAFPQRRSWPRTCGATFREFVVFDNNQTLVEYLVAYQRTRAGSSNCGELACPDRQEGGAQHEPAACCAATRTGRKPVQHNTGASTATAAGPPRRR